jgi:hypothetical protein
MMVASEADEAWCPPTLTQVVGVMDGPARQPQHLAFELAEDGEVGGGDGHEGVALWHAIVIGVIPGE